MSTFQTETILDCTPEAAFRFLIRPENIQKVTDPSLGLAFTNAPEQWSQGSRIEFQIRGIGPAQNAVHEIVEFEEPHRFVERQIEGPFKLWVHEHRFEPHNGTGVCIIDRVEFSPPGGLLGLLVTENRIEEMLEAGFEHRWRELKRHLESDSSSENP